MEWREAEVRLKQRVEALEDGGAERERDARGGARRLPPPARGAAVKAKLPRPRRRLLRFGVDADIRHDHHGMWRGRRPVWAPFGSERERRGP